MFTHNIVHTRSQAHRGRRRAPRRDSPEGSHGAPRAARAAYGGRAVGRRRPHEPPRKETKGGDYTGTHSISLSHTA
ncbi:hypothetical protein EVAR_77847_1 [Eumeta japonica]|uniref:Uncharacterized protein n=1 Tax=Eumeta variegata TaxID=151549 RepID=A0A4C1TDU7_EUMVA|nr:hypothetical protein EVAR_77847_1 [Eumeta japonica]